MRRALGWLVGGLVAFVLLVIAIAPELLGGLGQLGSALAIAMIAVVPAALLAAIFVSTRRRRRDVADDAHADERP